MFVGRENEIALLKALLKKKSASLVVIRGRRRVGKSRLVREFAHQLGINCYVFSGFPPESELAPAAIEEAQRTEFSRTLARYFHEEKKHQDWSDALFDLAKHTSKGKVLILLDEITWMAAGSGSFLGKLKNAWDHEFSKNPQLILVLCGSIASWIKKHIINSTGFYGRISLKLSVKPLSLSACKAFWGPSSLISAREKLKVLAVTGGIPKYLEEINPQLPAEENIKRLCFMESGILFNDFHAIFSSMLGKKSEYCRKIVMMLSAGKLEQGALLDRLGLKSSSNMIEYIEELVDAGFVERHYAWNLKQDKSSKLSQYRLADNYIRFYLNYIYPNSQKISDQLFQFKSLASLSGWSSIMALQVENLVLNNRHEIMQALRIPLEDVIQAGPYFQRATQRHLGCQIDLLIQTKINVLYVCEMKFSMHMIREEIIEEVKRKINAISVGKGFSICPVLIHASEVHERVIEENYFSHILDLSTLLTA